MCSWLRNDGCESKLLCPVILGIVHCYFVTVNYIKNSCLMMNLVKMSFNEMLSISRTDSWVYADYLIISLAFLFHSSCTTERVIPLHFCALSCTNASTKQQIYRRTVNYLPSLAMCLSQQPLPAMIPWGGFPWLEAGCQGLPPIRASRWGRGRPQMSSAAKEAATRVFRWFLDQEVTS